MKVKLLYEGKAKKVYTSKNENEYILEFKDDLTAFNAKQKDSQNLKGSLNKNITTQIFQMLEKEGIKTHFLKDIDKEHILVKKAKVIMIEVIVRNISTGSIVKRLGLEDKKTLPSPLVEFCYKNDDFDDPIINDEHALLMNLIDSQEETEYLKKTTRKINNILIKYFNKANLILVDFKIEFGKDDNGNIILVDEISPDSCRLWDKTTGKSLDKDIFRKNMGSVVSAYQEVLIRINN
jgi:phosphoribosylaminoimidazole-succinocarboxamide synthase